MNTRYSKNHSLILQYTSAYITRSPNLFVSITGRMPRLRNLRAARSLQMGYYWGNKTNETRNSKIRCLDLYLGEHKEELNRKEMESRSPAPFPVQPLIYSYLEQAIQYFCLDLLATLYMFFFIFLHVSSALVYLFLLLDSHFFLHWKSPFQCHPWGPYIATWYFALGHLHPGLTDYLDSKDSNNML